MSSNVAKDSPGNSSMYHAGKQKRIRVGGLHIARMIRCLMAGPHTHHDLAAETGLHWRTCRIWMAELKRAKLIRLCGMAPDTRGFLRTPLFEWAPDKPDWKPKAKTGAERSRELRTRRQSQISPSALNYLTALGECIAT